MEAYILQVILFQLLFLLVYEVLLKKETFFTYNRWYLLFAAAISLLLPLINIEALTAIFPSTTITQFSEVLLPEVFIGAKPEVIEQPTAYIAQQSLVIDWWLVIYGIGLLGSLMILFRKYQNLERLFRFRKISTERDFQIIEIPNSSIACTFYKTMFLGDKLSEAERQHILIHELVHVKQKHSLDLVFFEILKIIFWFNPLIYIFQKRITTLHEFIADADAVKTTEKANYYEQLLNSAFSTKNISFINQFYSHSLIKKRIVMLQRSRSKTTAKLKYLFIVPLMLVMLITVSFSENSTQRSLDSSEINNEIKPENLNPIMNQENMPFAIVDQVPEYPGCDQEDYESRKECLISSIRDHVNRNFNTVKVKPYTAKGSNRIMVVFEINSNGDVTGVKSKMVTPGPNPEAKAVIQEEANRVVASLPKMKPGKHNGKEIGVTYALPIEIMVPEEEEKK